MENFSIGSLPLLGPGVSGYILQKPVEGFDAPDYRTTYYDSPGQDYGVVSQAYYSSRTITLTGIVKGDTVSQYETNRNALAAACGINRDSNGYPVLTPITFTTLAGDEYFINVQFKKPTFPMNDITFTNFQLIALAPDARIYGAQKVDSGAITVAQGGGFTLPVTLPIVFANSSGGGAALTNNGNTASHPIVTFTGPLTNPYIRNVTTGLAFQLDYTIPGGSYVVVDMYNKTVLFNGNQNFINNIDPVNQDWFVIEPGPNNFILSTGNNADTGGVDVSFYPAYSGI